MEEGKTKKTLIISTRLDALLRAQAAKNKKSLTEYINEVLEAAIEPGTYEFLNETPIAANKKSE